MKYLKYFQEESEYTSYKSSTSYVVPNVSYVVSTNGIYYEATVITSNNEIWYTSTDDNIVTPYSTTVFGANIVSNTYENGKGIILFDGDVTTIGKSAFYNCDNLTSITILDGVTTIGESAFDNCKNLNSITIPNSVTTIGGYTFRNCYRLTSINIPDGVDEIGMYTFLGCNNLTSITIPDSVTTIGESAFNSCKSLTSVTIGNSVNLIGDSAFRLCNNLEHVYCKPTIPPTLYDSRVFNDVNGYVYATFYVPKESVEAYSNTGYWKQILKQSTVTTVGYDF